MKIDLSNVNKTILLVFGMPGSGKTTLCETITSMVMPGQYIYFNADKVRSTLSKDLGFSMESRQEQARRMGCMASLALDGSDARIAIVDFVNPNVDTWTAFRENLHRPVGKPKKTDVNRFPVAAAEDSEFPCFSVFMNTIKKEDCEYADTAAIFNSGNRPVDVTLQWMDSEREFKAAAYEILQTIGGAIV